MSNIVTKKLDVAGRELSFEVGRLAAQATSSVLARYGDSTILATVVIGREDLKKDYFPLSVEYQEKLYAGGRIKGSKWIKRERNTDEDTLSARLIDRSVRPLFPKTFKNEVQVIVMVLSTDTDNDTDVLGINAVSAALAISPIPFEGPVAAVRMGLEGGTLVTNPKNGNREGVDLDLVVTSTGELIPMIEAGASQVSEEVMYQGLEQAVAQNKLIISTINELVAEVGKSKIVLNRPGPDASFVSEVEKIATPLVEEYLQSASQKEGNSLEDIITQVSTKYEQAQKGEIPGIIENLVYKILRSNILQKDLRADGRKLDQIRPLDVQVGVLPRVHGSAIFQRGQTQALTVTTLGAPSLGQSTESAEGEGNKRYMHHYNFPPFSTGETGKVGSPKRREIGHGALAERALAPVIPSEADFPYAIRVVSEIMSSNGSSSMASSCGSTMSLMDAGVPLKAPVSGISTGLITGSDYPKNPNSYKLITDIIGLEDHYGDMDFKVAGTKDGITAIQLDTKVAGLTLDICKATFVRAKAARAEVLKAMLAVLAEPRKEVSTYAPKISTVHIPTDKIGELIGPGGKNIKKLMADTGTTVDVNDEGNVFISGVDAEGTARAIAYVTGMGKEVVAGEIYEGVVARIQPFGAFVTILPGKDGLLHVSQMAEGFVSDPNQYVKEGQTVKVWVVSVDDQGKIALSSLFDEAGVPKPKAREERAPRMDTGGGRPAFQRRDDRGGHPAGGTGHFSAPRRRGF